MNRILFLIAVIFVAGCDESFLNMVTQAEHERPLDSPKVVEQFGTNDPNSPVRYVAWREPAPPGSPMGGVGSVRFSAGR